MSEQRDERVVEREITLDAPSAAVWKALTDAAELMRWFPLEARVSPGRGGAVWMRWDDAYDAESAIDIWEPERHLRIRFPHERAMHLATDYYLEGRGGGTVLRVVTSGFGAGGLGTVAVDARYTARTTTGHVLTGVVRLWQPPLLFAGTVEGCNDALFRLELQGKDGARELWFWLATYGVPAAAVRSIEQAWRKSLAKLFEEPAAQPR